jgi:hypothetical protein
MQAGGWLGDRTKSDLYLAYRSVHPLPPLRRLIAAGRRFLKIGVFRYPPYAGLQYDRPTTAVSVSRITKVVQIFRLLWVILAPFLLQLTLSPSAPSAA